MDHSNKFDQMKSPHSSTTLLMYNQVFAVLWHKNHTAVTKLAHLTIYTQARVSGEYTPLESITTQAHHTALQVGCDQFTPNRLTESSYQQTCYQYSGLSFSNFHQFEEPKQYHYFFHLWVYMWVCLEVIRLSWFLFLYNFNYQETEQFFPITHSGFLTSEMFISWAHFLLSFFIFVLCIL